MQDQVVPKGKWVFDDDVTKCFEDMLQRSIPQHDEMRRLVQRLCQNFQQHDSYILDLGCSLGETLAQCYQQFKEQNKYLGIENSEPMLKSCRSRFQEHENIKIMHLDLRNEFPQVSCSLVLSILTIQFIPIEYRQNLLKKIYNSLNPGGAFIFVEKILGDTAELNRLMIDVYYDKKRENGYSDIQIESKRVALENVLVPLSANFNTRLLYQAGFSQVDCFWRWMNFAGWVAVK